MDDKKLKILLVDDDAVVRGTYAEVFAKEGFEVSEASDGLEGLDKATKDVPDIIFTGIIMPKMDGFAFKEALAKNVSTSGIPVFISSHMGREEDRQKSQELGAKGFIVLGMISPREVVEKIKAIFEKKEYKIKFDGSELDAKNLAQDFHLNSQYLCPNCYSRMIMVLKISDTEKNEFMARFACPKCG